MSPRPKPIFVVGTPRSGTTLVRLLLDSHPELAIAPESAFLMRLVSRCGLLYRELQTEAAVRGLIEDALAITAVAAWFPPELGVDDVMAHLSPEPSAADVLNAIYTVWAQRRGKGRWGDKTPRNLQHSESLLGLFPEARFIVVLRDPRDVALSLAKASFSGISPLGAAERWALDAAYARDLSTYHPAATLVVRYEALTAEPARWCERMLAFVGAAPCPDLLARYQEHSDDVAHAKSSLYLKPVDASRAERWRAEGDSDLIRQVEAIAGEEMAHWGYERAHPDAKLGRRARWEAGLRDVATSLRNREYMTNYRDAARIALSRARRFSSEG